jgi:hypothetical protein
MRNQQHEAQTGLPRLSVAGFAMLLVIGVLNLAQTSPNQWNARPEVICENGQTVHRYAEVNATRVNIRDLPTVFSNVLTQKNQPDAVTVVCEFGVWSRIALLDVAPETWISTGLITLTPTQPLTAENRAMLIGLFTLGMVGLLISLYRPHWLHKTSDALMQTQYLPPHARPLISVTPEYHPARDAPSHRA